MSYITIEEFRNITDGSLSDRDASFANFNLKESKKFLFAGEYSLQELYSLIKTKFVGAIDC